MEIDEAYIGGKIKKLGKPGEGDKKVAVLGMVQRGGNIITRVVPNAKGKTLQPHIHKHVKKGSRVSTDQYGAYRGILGKHYAHISVNHAQKEWVKGETHTNTIEGFWSHFKTSVRGTHKSVSRQHMMNYLHEFEFRFNLRRDVSGSMFDKLIKAF